MVFAFNFGKILAAKFVIKFFNKKCKVKCIFAIEKKQLMSLQQNSDAFYKKLRSQLYDTAKWPSEYLYKFIVPTNVDKIKIIEDLFNNLGAVIHTVESKNGKYTSVSINVRMKDPDAVILKYREVAKQVKGVISL
jgi:putative lipoic acid-binding regulatory protein